VGLAAAHVALYQSARSRGYKLSREGADPRSLLGDGCVRVDVLARCVYVLSFAMYSIQVDCLYVLSLTLDVAPASSFIASKERARVTFMVKR
jgi:hypothetical protein